MTEAQEDDQKSLELPPPTAPANISVSLRAFADEGAAKRFADLIASVVRSISCVIDLERLDGITVAFDYDRALAELDRGYHATRMLTRTNDEQIVGVAMAPPVLRNGVVKAHMVFYAPAVQSLESEGTADFKQALGLVAHECAHVEALKHMDTAFPGLILQKQIVDAEYKVFGQVAEAIWDEYAACRIGALFADDRTTSSYQDGLVGVLKVCREKTNAAIRAYRLHADIERVLKDAGGPLCEPLRLIAYLIGHLDGRREDLNAAPIARDSIASSPYAAHLENLITVLRTIWSRLGRWESLEEFSPLRSIVREVLKDGGLIVERRSNDALHVKIPFTPDTMP